MADDYTTNDNIITPKELIRRLGVSKMAVSQWSKEDPPIPSTGSGMTRRYNWVSVQAWRDERRCRKCPHRNQVSASREEHGGTGDTTEATEKTLLVRAQRELKELELARQRRETVSTQDYEAALVAMIVPTRLNLMAIGAKLRGQIGNEAANLVDAEIKRALRLLATGE